MGRDWNFIIGYLRCAKRFYCIDWAAPCLAVFMFLETGIKAATIGTGFIAMRMDT